MPVICKVRPVASNGIITCTIDSFNAAQDPYRIAPYDKLTFPYPYTIERPSAEIINLLSSVVTHDSIIDVLGNYPMKLFSIRARTLTRSGHEENTPESKEAANFFYDLFKKTSRQLRSYTPFMLELGHPRSLYSSYYYTFMPTGHPGTKAIRGVKHIIQDEVAKCIPADIPKSIIYRLFIHNRNQDRRSPWDKQKATVVILVKPNYCLKWHEVQSQIQNAVNDAKAGGKKDVEIRLELMTAEKSDLSVLEELEVLRKEKQVIFAPGDPRR